MSQPTDVAAGFFRALENHDNDLFNEVIGHRRDDDLGVTDAILAGDLSIDYEDLEYTETRVDDRHTTVEVRGRFLLQGAPDWSDLATTLNLVLAGDDTSWYLDSVGREFP